MYLHNTKHNNIYTQGEKAHYLHIGLKTGIIRLAQTVDRESNEQIRVTVIAKDKGTPSLSGSTILRVSIQDANDNPPTFTNLREHQANNPVLIKEGNLILPYCLYTDCSH